MAYQATALRRRPRRFEDLVGQDFTATTLQKSIEAGKIAAAYLFSGPRGCGKTSTARILATALNCAEGPTPEPCGNCPSCIEITQGNYLDVIEIDGASNTSVNDVRQIKDEIVFPPHSARYKIYIIDEVHMLSASAFNALLKTIEEPPAHVVFIFATTELHKVPATIRSRCQQFYFKLLSIEDLFNTLQETVKELDINAEDGALYWIARQATGSLRDAYTLFDQVLAFSGDVIELETIQNKLGLPGLEPIAQLIEACADGNAPEALQVLDAILLNGASVEQCVIDCAEYMRSLLFIAHGITKEAVLGADPAQFSKKALSVWSRQQLEHGCSLFLQLFKDLRFSLEQRYELELLIVRLTHLEDYVSASELKQAFDAAQAVLAGSALTGAEKKNDTITASTAKAFESIRVQAVKPKIEPVTPIRAQAPSQTQTAAPIQIQTAPAAAEQTQKKTISFDTLQEHIIEQLQEENSILAFVLKKTENWQLHNNAIHIEAQSTFDIDTITKKKILLQELASAALQKRVIFEVELKKDKQPSGELQIPEKIQMLCKELNGRIIANQALS